MTVYTVHAPPGAEPDPLKLAFVKEGFCWPALFIPVLWLLWRRMWLTLVGYVAGGLILAVIADRIGDGGLLLIFLFAFWFALEANEFRRGTLSRAGWRLIGVAEGRKRLEAERSFFERHGVPAPAAPERPAGPPPLPPPSGRVPPPAGRPVIGLFPEGQR